MPNTTTHEISLHLSTYCSPKGYSWVLLEQLRILPRPKYRYTVHSLGSSDLFLPDRMLDEIIQAWHDVYTSEAAKKLGRCAIDYTYTNTLAYKQDVMQRFRDIRAKGWPGEVKPGFIEWKYHQARKWVHVEGLVGETLETALLNLSAAVNGKQLSVPDGYAQRLRDELTVEFDWEIGIKSMPLLLAAFVQAFSELPLKRKVTAAQVIAMEKGYV